MISRLDPYPEHPFLLQMEARPVPRPDFGRPYYHTLVCVSSHIEELKKGFESGIREKLERMTMRVSGKHVTARQEIPVFITS